MTASQRLAVALLTTLGLAGGCALGIPRTRAVTSPSETPLLVTVRPHVRLGDLLLRRPSQLSHATQQALTDSSARPLQLDLPDGATVYELPTGAAVPETSDVVAVQPNYSYHALLTPNDPRYAQQWNLPIVNAPAAWDLDVTAPTGGGDPSVTVAVLDTGVAYEQFGSFQQLPDFATTSFAVGYDFVNSDSHANDDNGHGTHVSGTIAAMTDNGTGAAGIAYRTTLMPVKVLDATGGGSTATIAQGVDFARANGAHVINLSLGGSDDDPLLQAAIQRAVDAGIVVVAATGNDADASLLYPAAYSTTIAVGATRFDSTKAPYSNYGEGIDLMAPGGDLDVDQGGDGQPDGIIQETCSNVGCTSFSAYYYEGTSQAAPQVSATVALLLAAGATSSEVQTILQATATDLATPGYDTTTGYGLLNIASAVSSVSGSGTTPAGSLTIAGGASGTGSALVDLTVAVSSGVTDVVSMSFSNDNATFSAWEPIAATRTAWDLTAAATGGTAGDGTKQVWVRFQTSTESVSSSVSDSIVLDRTPPAAPTIAGWASAKRERPIAASGQTTTAQPTFSFSADDALTGVASYQASLTREDGTTLAATTVTTPVYASPELGTPGVYTLTVAAQDQAGNASPGSTFTFTLVRQGIAVATGAGARPQVALYDESGTLIRRFNVFESRATGGLSVATGDVDGDGASEVVVGSGPGRTSEVRIYALTGKLERRFRVRGRSDTRGVTVAVGDVRGNSALEIVTGSVRGVPDVRIFSARGTFLKRFSAFGASDQDGVSVAVGDFQGKGAAEIAVAQRQGGAPRLRFFSGTGRRLRTVTVGTTSQTHGLLISAGDVNADGADEVIVGDASGPSAEVRVYRRTGRRLARFQPYPKGARGGAAAAASDVDADGSDELITAPTGPGAKYVKAMTLQGQAQVGVHAIAPTRTPPTGGYTVAAVVL